MTVLVGAQRCAHKHAVEKHSEATEQQALACLYMCVVWAVIECYT